MSAKQNAELFLGLMSGTSLDGIDCALVSFKNARPTIENAVTCAFSDSLGNRLKKSAQTGLISFKQLGELNANLAIEYARAVEFCLDGLDLSSDQISAIGCHGQTVWHSPDTQPAFTLQLGDPSRLSVLTNIAVVADFRSKDMALGGQGAPLAPAFHADVFSSDTEDRVILNLGGIANITFLPANSADSVIGLDTGPANTLLDNWIEESLSLPFDNNGDWAKAGKVNRPLLDKMLCEEPYFAKSLPKTTGTEYFSRQWLHQYTRDSSIAAQDVQATLAELTAVSVANEIKRLPTYPKQCFVCGGGVMNNDLIQRIKLQLPDCEVASTQTLGIDPNFVEATAFAWLARRTINGQSGNLPSVTNASRQSILGGIYWP